MSQSMNQNMNQRAFGYISVVDAESDSGVEAARTCRDQLAHAAEAAGYDLGGVFIDVRGQSESGMYRLMDALGRHEAEAVITPDLEHLRHASCLRGADIATAARFLHTRLLTLDGCCANERGVEA